MTELEFLRVAGRPAPRGHSARKRHVLHVKRRAAKLEVAKQLMALETLPRRIERGATGAIWESEGAQTRVKAMPKQEIGSDANTAGEVKKDGRRGIPQLEDLAAKSDAPELIEASVS